MARFRINWRFSSAEAGPWQEGDEVELSPEKAAWVNRCSPGVLTEIADKQHPTESDKPKKSKRKRSKENPPSDRMVKEAEDRTPNHGPITKKGFKVVRN